MGVDAMSPVTRATERSLDIETLAASVAQVMMLMLRSRPHFLTHNYDFKSVLTESCDGSSQVKER
jgi:hypothetical protein